MSKGLFLALVMVVSAGFISGCQNKAPEEQTLEISAPAEGVAGAPVESPAQIQITQPQEPVQPAQIQVPVSAAVPEALPEAQSQANISQEFIPPSAQDIQQALKNAGLYDGEIDGKVGPKTNKAIEEFQAKNNLKADGKVGRKTWEKMKEYLNMPAAVSQEAVN